MFKKGEKTEMRSRRACLRLARQMSLARVRMNRMARQRPWLEAAKAEDKSLKAKTELKKK